MSDWKPFECPVCNLRGPTERWKAFRHPLESILEPYGEGSMIFEHAEEIAVEWPGFPGHPAFALILDKSKRSQNLLQNERDRQPVTSVSFV